MDLESVNALVKADMEAVNAVIGEQIRSAVPTIPALGVYIIGSGGKRLRPIVLLLAARMGGHRGRRHVPLGAVVEFIHTATLLHDDVVDGSEMRRSQATANHVWGNAAAVLVGDFLYARAFEMMVQDGDIRILATMAEATSIIAQGEVRQLENAHNADIDEATYLAVIQAKTAKLFEAAARMGGIINSVDRAAEEGLARYGSLLGTAFQLIDDALDYSASAERFGKNVGDDLAEGKPTLPFIHAIRVAEPEDRVLLRAALEEEGRERLPQVLDIIARTGAMDYTVRLAKGLAAEARACLGGFADGPERQALEFLADFSVGRDF